MSDAHTNQAVIYCRVSSSKQTKVGDGLKSQETRCRDFARMKGYEVLEVFSDDISGSKEQRPGMMRMLSFVRKQKGKGTRILMMMCHDLRAVLKPISIYAVKSPKSAAFWNPLSIEFGEDSDSILVENLLASVSQHQRQKNGEQTKNRMKARVQMAIGCFKRLSVTNIKACLVAEKCFSVMSLSRLLFKKRLRATPSAILKRRPMFSASYKTILSFLRQTR